MILFIGILVGVALFFTCFAAIMMRMDYMIDNWMFKLLEPFTFLAWFDIFGKGIVITFIATILIIYLLKKRKIYGALTVFMTLGGGLILKQWIKVVVGRERPPYDHGVDGFSFVSGHAMQGTILYILSSYFLVQVGLRGKHKFAIYSIGVALAVFTGLGRIVEKVHYFTDVAAGFGLGISIALLGIYVYEKTDDFQ